MKSTFTMLICLVTINLSAQIYHPFQTSATNPNWSMAFWIGPGFSPNFSWYEIDIDTTIASQTYGKVEHYYPGSSYYEGAIREDSAQHIFFIPKDSVNEMLIYDFSKQLNDTLFNIWCNKFGNWGQDTLVITMADSMLLNGNYYDRFLLQTLSSSGYMEWFESIGSTGDLIRHEPYVGVSGANYLTCFHNNASLIYTTNQPFGWTGSTTCYLANESYEVQWIETYPNPATDFIRIDQMELFNNPLFEIINVNGQVVLSGNIGTNQIPIDDLMNGIYVLRILSKETIYMTKFIKR